MPVSPCTFRSAQCAALIALAAAAGIQRVEAETTTARSLPQADHPAAVAAFLPGAAAPLLSLNSTRPGGWFRDAFAFVLSFLAAPADQVPGDAVASFADGDSIPPASESLDADVCSATPPARALLGQGSNATVFHWCNVPHALAYAVGPPAGESAPPPAAVGIAMPGVFAANGLWVIEAAPLDEVSSLARLARPLSPGRITAGLSADTVTATPLARLTASARRAGLIPGRPLFPS